jgi:hypothetical protein
MAHLVQRNAAMTSISNTLPSGTRDLPGSPAGRQAVKDLATALKAGDLQAAKVAYGQVVRNAPEGATWNPEGAFAQMGRALKAGDMAAAQEVAKAAWNDLKQDLKPVTPPATPGVPEPVAAPSTTGGTAGTLLNVVA